MRCPSIFQGQKMSLTLRSRVLGGSRKGMGSSLMTERDLTGAGEGESSPLVCGAGERFTETGQR